MFNLKLLLDIAEGRPGMLVPVFSSDKTNMPYVQQMDEFLIVKDIIPFLEYENYLTLPAERALSISLGDKGVIAFRSTDNEIVCGDLQDVLSYVGDHGDLVSKDTVLKLQLNRIESAELQPSYDNWRKVATQVFNDADQSKFWINSELQLFQKQRRIWREIDRLDAEVSKGSDEEAIASLRQRSTEYLVRWLSQRANFASRNWTKLWHYVHERLPFDDRVTQIAVSWMYALDADSNDFSQTKSIIYALLQGWSTLGRDYPDYGEYLSERLASEPTMLFCLLRPKHLFQQLFDYLAQRGNLDDVLKLLSFCVSDLPREQYITNTVQSALEAIIHFEQAAHAPRDFEHRHIQRAYVIAKELRETI